MNLMNALPRAPRALLFREEYAELRVQAERLHERIPFGAVTAFIAEGAKDAGDTPGSPDWKLRIAAKADALLAADPADLDI
ncbi:hypothetical protein ACFOWE_17930 [Planomonospora corallina]|uniref:Uncharacterized protein n=1 Tax=Planomonospora corallina TaxID=1806052 RepID=A0ABV8IAU3_9ACTN